MMTRTKNRNGRRQTAYVPPKGRRKKRKLQDGRPRGTYKKYPFEQTRLGFLLKYEMPVVYRLLMLRYKDVPFPQPSPDVIRVICRGSRDKTCKKGKFKRAFEEYARNGICCRRPKLLTEKRKSYYDSIRKKKMQAFIRENREKIEQMRKQTFKNNIKKTP